jgi:hypothetical protein
VVREAGVVLGGLPVEVVFPAVPEADHFDSLPQDLDWEVEHLLYGVLSGSRVWATIAERRLHWKLSGAVWALERAPERFRRLVEQAIALYRGDREDAEFDKPEVDAYRSYLRYATVRACPARTTLDLATYSARVPFRRVTRIAAAQVTKDLPRQRRWMNCRISKEVVVVLSVTGTSTAAPRRTRTRVALGPWTSSMSFRPRDTTSTE